MSQHTFKRLCGKYVETQDKTQIGDPMGNVHQPVDQNSSQQQTRSKANFQKYYYDPTRLMASNGAPH